MKPAFVLESWIYRLPSGALFVLRHLSFVKIAMLDRWLRELILGMISCPGEEVDMTYLRLA
jgi:hypothetical protein